MSITAVTPVKAAQPPQSNTPATDQQPAGIGKGFVSVTNVPIGTRVLAALGNVKAGIRVADSQGDKKTLETLYNTGCAKLLAAGAKRKAADESLLTAEAKLSSLRYDSSPAKTFEAQKAQNRSATECADAIDNLRIARRDVEDQTRAIEKYWGRLALVFQSLENVKSRQP